MSIFSIFTKHQVTSPEKDNTVADNIGTKNKQIKPKRSIKIHEPITAAIITDLHNTAYRIPKSELEDKLSNCDVFFLLGDNTSDDIEYILSYLDLSKTYGIYGNHDNYNDHLYEKYNIPNIHEKLITVKDSTFVGWEGSFKYKPTAIGMTQEESIEFAKTLPDADFLISHDSPYNDKCPNTPHAGLKGITAYQERTGCFDIHGHVHDRYETPTERCFYKIEKATL